MGCQHTKLNAGEKIPENCAMDGDESNQVISNHRVEDLEPVVVSPRQKEIIFRYLEVVGRKYFKCWRYHLYELGIEPASILTVIFAYYLWFVTRVGQLF
ncbi:hypothetical protein CEXT_584261 [Caerostris extrusa]|uniref:Uncharacterized protein n=1 Tax=Caerostris extrusa TaxID=172846 RepID=A0AAV4QXM1_CAEEX|nr:hypothetical protein CEXT_584261 [Caerostris extrusa]